MNEEIKMSSCMYAVNCSCCCRCFFSATEMKTHRASKTKVERKWRYNRSNLKECLSTALVGKLEFVKLSKWMTLLSMVAIFSAVKSPNQNVTIKWKHTIESPCKWVIRTQTRMLIGRAYLPCSSKRSHSIPPNDINGIYILISCIKCNSKKCLEQRERGTNERRMNKANRERDTRERYLAPEV